MRSELINYRNRHPHEANPANGVHTKKEVQRIQDLENMVRALYVKIEKQKKSIDKQAKKMIEKDKVRHQFVRSFVLNSFAAS